MTGYFPPEEYDSCRKWLNHGFGLSDDEASDIIQLAEGSAFALSWNGLPRPGELRSHVAIIMSLRNMGISIEKTLPNLESAFQCLAQTVNQQTESIIKAAEETGLVKKIKKNNGWDMKLQQAYYRLI